jgi:hypothetical protein
VALPPKQLLIADPISSATSDIKAVNASKYAWEFTPLTVGGRLFFIDKTKF